MSQAPLNRTLHITAAVAGMTLAVAGLHHGFFEVLQGNRPTPGLGIHSIGPEHVRWAYGTDDAITLIPNFLVTGVAAMTVSLGIIAWSALGLKRSRGPSVFLALFVLLTLVGGGMGHIPSRRSSRRRCSSFSASSCRSSATRRSPGIRIGCCS